MIKACLFVREDPALLNNRFFSETTLYGMKSDMYMYVQLKKDFQLRGVDLSTQDINPVKDSTIVIVLNETGSFVNYSKPEGQHLYLILSEPPVYNYRDWLAENHRVFDKVFVYDNRRVDNKKYLHYNFAIDFESFPEFKPVSETEFTNRRLCALMAGSFSVIEHKADVQSLLFERYKAIQWFNRNHPNDFDFYSRASLENKLEEFRGASLLKKLAPAFVKQIGKLRYQRNVKQVFQGSADADKKIDFLRKYRFYLCYENTHGINGLISEKLFDCFAAACIPIYLGAPDLSNYVPKNCYIDKNDFKSYKQLYLFIKDMNYQTYAGYIQNIHNFMSGPMTKPFTVSTFTNNIISHIDL